MAEHGYAREYDEGWDREDEREPGERDWREREGSDWRQRDRNFMLDDPQHHDRHQRGRGFFSRMSDEARDWFGDDEEEGTRSRDRDRHGFGGAQERGARGYSSHPDDHYRSWRDRQMEALDRDYADYCREREQQFHQEFDSWRSNRQQSRRQQEQQQQQQQQGGDSDEELVLSEAEQAAMAPSLSPRSPMSTATGGTNNSENTTGRRRG